MATVKICDICGSITGPILNYYLPKPVYSSTCKGLILRFEPKEYDICEDCAMAITKTINNIKGVQHDCD